MERQFPAFSTYDRTTAEESFGAASGAGGSGTVEVWSRPSRGAPVIVEMRQTALPRNPPSGKM